MRTNVLIMIALGALSASAGLKVSFDASNSLERIQVGNATFATGKGDLWSAKFSAGWSERAKVVPSQSCRRTFRETAEEIVLGWNGLDIDSEHGVLDGEVHIAKRPDGSQAWTLRFVNRSTKWALLETDFPRLANLVEGGDVMLPWKDHGARLYRNWQNNDKRGIGVYPYLGYFPQVAAAFVGDDGLYLAPEDPDARQKMIVVSAGKSVTYRTAVEWGGAVGKTAEGPRYPVVLAPLKGDWWQAANRYREFALRQKWCAKGPIKDIKNYPHRMAEIPLWINVHCGANEASNLLTRAKAIFTDFSTGLHWHLWQHSGHDINYPEYFPEQPGTKECIAHCQAIGQEPMPYTNGRLWTANSAGFIMAEPYAVMRADGKRAIEGYAPAPSLAVMCPSCPKWRQVVQMFTGRVLNELGAKSIFIDQIGAAQGNPCYDPSHSHPAGGGGWWYEGYDAMMQPIRAAYNAKGAMVTTEGSGEAYIGMVDGFLQVVGRTPEDVPFLNAVYSGYTTYFCSPENNDDSLDAFRALQTRELLWGNSLGWFLSDILDRPDKCALLNKLCTFRQQHLDALAYGNLLDELRFVSKVGTHTYEWLGRRPHNRLFDKSFKLPKSSFATMSDIIGNWWRRADGKVVLFVANLTNVPQKATYRVYGSDKCAEVELQPLELKSILP